MARTKKTSVGVGARGRAKGSSAKAAQAGPARSGKTAVRAAKRVKAPGRQKVRPAVKKTKPPRAGKKTHLSRKQLAEFREMLLQKRKLLLGDLSGMEVEAAGQKGSGNLSSMPTHMADVGTDNFEHEFTLGLLESEQALLREINEALARIEDRTYGICLGTGKTIPRARLRAKPWAKYTVEYTRMIEKGQARPAEEREEDESAEEMDLEEE